MEGFTKLGSFFVFYRTGVRKYLVVSGMEEFGICIKESFNLGRNTTEPCSSFDGAGFKEHFAWIESAKISAISGLMVWKMLLDMRGGVRNFLLL